MREWTQNNRTVQCGTHFPLCVKFDNVCRRTKEAEKRRLEKRKARLGTRHYSNGRKVGPLSADPSNHSQQPSRASDGCPTSKTKGDARDALNKVADSKAGMPQRAATHPVPKCSGDISDAWSGYVGVAACSWDSSSPWSGYAGFSSGWHTAPAATDWGDTAPAANGWCTDQSSGEGWVESSAAGRDCWSAAPAVGRWM